MRFATICCFSLLSACCFAQGGPAPAGPAPLVVISVDGMKPEYVTQADQHGLKIPVLRQFLTYGTYAEGVVGVIPTVTYPSHTTLVTGVWPAQHGVVDNTTFDPLREHPGAWYWDFADIQVPTLYTVADAAGIKTANVAWPVTVGAPIDYNIAEGTQSEHTDRPSGPPLHPADLLEQLGITLKRDKKGEPQNGDPEKTAEAVGILQKFHPGLLLVHLTDLDHQEHVHGPFSPEADRTLEAIDGQIGQIRAAALAVNPATRIAIVSDHGFLPTTKRTNLNVLFAQAGLITLGPERAVNKSAEGGVPEGTGPSVVSWQAEAWPAGGSNAIVLKDPSDKALEAKVRAILEKAKADPADGIETLLTHEEVVARGGFPGASFLVDYRDGWDGGNAYTGPVVVPSSTAGMHGYLPSRAAMRSTFMIEGEGVAQGKDLQVVDMRQIAPTLAGLLGVTLPDAKQPMLDVKR